MDPAGTLLEKARSAAHDQKPFTVKSYKLPTQTEQQLVEVLGVFLEELNQGRLKDSLGYCLRELAVNGKKANTKRVYFEEKGLKLVNPADYQSGMKSFKQETLGKIDYWLQKQEEAGLYVRVTFHIQGRDLYVRVGNNTTITRKEQIRIYDRIARSRAFKSLEEAMTSVMDDSEGAGLGIVILVLMLKKIGLDEDAFDIDIENEETVARLVIPMDKATVEHLSEISNELIEQIESLPQFPENILELQRKIDDPDVQMGDVAQVLSRDPSLTADLLRTVNSARYMLPRRMDNVVEAVKVVGLRGLKQMLYSYGTRRVLGESDTETGRHLWEHSQKTAFYAYGIARNVYRRKEILDDVYVGGILHDMGKIVFSNIHPDVIDRMMSYCRRQGIPSTLLEAMSDGIDHAEVGGRLAERWNFPEALVQSIRYHHAPLRAHPNHRDVVCVVAVANILVHQDEFTPEAFDTRVLRILGIKNLEQLRQIHDQLQRQYERAFQQN